MDSVSYALIVAGVLLLIIGAFFLGKNYDSVVGYFKKDDAKNEQSGSGAGSAQAGAESFWRKYYR